MTESNELPKELTPDVVDTTDVPDMPDTLNFNTAALSLALSLLQPAIKAWLTTQLTTGKAEEVRVRLKLTNEQMTGIAEYLSSKIFKIINK